MKTRISEVNIDTIIGLPIQDVLAMDIDFGPCYPTVDEDRTICRPGYVDGNYSQDCNNGDWEIIGDQYAIAITKETQ